LKPFLDIHNPFDLHGRPRRGAPTPPTAELGLTVHAEHVSWQRSGGHEPAALRPTRDDRSDS